MGLSPYDFMDNDSAMASTTIADNTTLNGQRLLVDWVSASFVFASDLHKVLELIGIDDFDNIEVVEGARYKMAGYNITYYLSRLEIMYSDVNNMWLLNFSGEACREFELASIYTIPELLAILVSLNANINRLDIAIDDFDNIFNVNMIRNAVNEGRCVTRLEEWGDHKKGKIKTGNQFLTMDNYYLGSRYSRYFLNIYDKKLEQKAKNKEVNVKTWTRTEIRFSYEYAEQFTEYLIEKPNNIGYLVKSFLNDKFCFLTPSSLKKDENKSRLTKDKKNITRWWKKFIGNVGKLNISVDVPEKTLDETKEWIFEKVSTSLAMLKIYNPLKYDDLINNLTTYGLGKMEKKHFRKVENQFYLDKIIEKKEVQKRDFQKNY